LSTSPHNKFSEDVVPLSDLKVNPGKIITRANDNKRPILVTSRGRGVAVVQGLEDYEMREEKVALATGRVVLIKPLAQAVGFLSG
jgi:prevent-host-death family protein